MAKKAKYYQRPDGLYEVSRTIGGKRVRFRGRTCREVDQKILAYNQEQKHGRKLQEVADDWQREHELTVSESTRRVYNVAVNRLIRAMGGRYVGDIKPIDLRRYIMAVESEGYGKQTIGVELTVIKQIFSYAVLHGDIDISPASEVKRSKGLPEVKRPALTVEQERAVEACRSGEYWLVGMMLLYTGMRRGELMGLDWQDIDRKAGVIHVTKKVNTASGRAVLEHHLKSENGKRDIPLLAPLAAVLPRNRIGHVLPGKNGEYMQSWEWTRLWKRYQKDAGLEGVTAHQFRHSFATICYEAGVDIKTAASLLGDTEDVVAGVYQELRQGQRQSGADKLEDYLTRRKA